MEYINKTQIGTYVGLKFDYNTKQIVKEYIENNKIPNPVNIDKIHSTLLYSRKYIADYEPIGKLDESWYCEPSHFSIFENDPKNGENNLKCLVLEYKCSKQLLRFDELMKKHNATYDFPEYNTHITLSYDVGNLDYKKLPKFEKYLKIIEEYSRDLKF